MALTGRVIEEQSFRREVFKGEDFRLISHCTFESCFFHDCNFDLCTISSSSMLGCKFNIGCSWKRLKLAGVCSFEGSNIEVLDLREGGRGYVTVIDKKGITINCKWYPWNAPVISRREVLTYDRKNALLWWEKHKGMIFDIGRKRGWYT